MPGDGGAEGAIWIQYSPANTPHAETELEFIQSVRLYSENNKGTHVPIAHPTKSDFDKIGVKNGPHRHTCIDILRNDNESIFYDALKVDKYWWVDEKTIVKNKSGFLDDNSWRDPELVDNPGLRNSAYLEMLMQFETNAYVSGGPNEGEWIGGVKFWMHFSGEDVYISLVGVHSSPSQQFSAAVNQFINAFPEANSDIVAP
jgi:hypothetical protein